MNDLQNYDVTNEPFNRLIKKCHLPVFQRKIVWNNKKIISLLISILKGFPIGHILLSPYKDEIGKFLLVDGLQRLTAIDKIIKNLYIFLNKKEILEVLINNCFAEILEEIFKEFVERKSNPKEFEKQQNNFKKDILKTVLIILKENKSSYTEEITKKIDIWFNNKDFIMKDCNEKNKFNAIILILKLYNQIENKIKDIQNIPIYYINYYGDESNLPFLFTSLNTGTQSLTKYEIYASKWSNYKLNINTRDDKKKSNSILKNICEFYKNKLSETKNIQIEKLDDLEKMINKPTPEIVQINLHEYCIGIGWLLQDLWFYKSNKEKLDKKISMIGFDFINLLLFKDENLEQLSIFFNKHSKDDNMVMFLLDLKNMLLESFRTVFMLLNKNLVNENMNSKNSKYYIESRRHVEFIYASFILNNYSIDKENLKITKIIESKRNTKDFKKFSIFYIIIDILNKEFTSNRQMSSVISKLNEKDIKRYLSMPSNEEINCTLEENLEEIIKTEKKVISSTNKLVLNYLFNFIKYNKIVDNSEKVYIENNKFEYDHIFPKSCLEHNNIKDNKSNFFNIGLISSENNKIKSNNNINKCKEFNDKLKSNNPFYKIFSINFDWENKNKHRDDYKESYQTLLRNRSDAYINIFHSIKREIEEKY